MEEKQRIISLCNDLKINYDDTFATANSVTIDNNRLKCKSIYLKRKESQLYVICYAKQLESYFAWSLRTKKANTKTYFSVNIPTNIIPEQDGITRIEKILNLNVGKPKRFICLKKIV